jgi:ribonuclease HI
MAYMEAKAALQGLNISSDTEEEEVEIFNDSDTDSNTSESTEYYSDANDSNTS